MSMFSCLKPMTLALCLLAPAMATAGELKDETLLVSMPPGFKIGFQTTRNDMTMQEWVPAGETVDNWSEMITTQVFLGKAAMDPAQMLNNIGQQWLAACKGSVPNTINTGHANGYTVSMLLLRCPLNPTSGKPEITLFRAIKGTDSFYLVQRAARYEVTAEQITQTAKYLASVNVCDTRTTEHPCPDLKAQGFTKQ